MLEDIAESVVGSIAAQQASLDFLGSVVLGNRTAPDYLRAEPGGVCAWPSPPAHPGSHFWGG